MLGWKPNNNRGFFHSDLQNNPWLQFQLNKVAVITSVMITNRKDCCGQRLSNIDVRAGMKKNILENPVVGFFKGPGATGGSYTVKLKKSRALFIGFVLKGKGYLQLQGVKLNGIVNSKGKLQK